MRRDRVQPPPTTTTEGRNNRNHIIIIIIIHPKRREFREAHPTLAGDLNGKEGGSRSVGYRGRTRRMAGIYGGAHEDNTVHNKKRYGNVFVYVVF